MVFAKRLREGVRRGEITCSVRIWTRPHVKVGNRYRMEEGEIEVDSMIVGVLLPVKQEDFRRTSLTISMICRSFGVSLSGFLSEPEQEKNLSKQELTRAVRARLG